jgi:hypothetical protein
MGSRVEKATFWVGVAGALGTIAALGLVVGTVNTSDTHFREPWFGIGVGAGILAVIALVIGLIIYFLHRGERDGPTPPASTTPGGEIDIPAGSTVYVGQTKIVLSKDTKLRVDGTLDGVES